MKTNIIQLNTTFQTEMPEIVIIEKRLKQLYNFYGDVLLACYRGKKLNREIIRHLGNLQGTYGIDLVHEVYELVFIPDLTRQAL